MVQIFSHSFQHTCINMRSIYFFVDQEPSSFILATMVPFYGNIWGVGYSFNLTPNRSVDFYYFSLNGLLNDDGIFYKQGCQQGCRWGCWWCCQSKKDAANKDAGDAGDFSYSWSLIASMVDSYYFSLDLFVTWSIERSYIDADEVLVDDVAKEGCCQQGCWWCWRLLVVLGLGYQL